MKKRIWVIILTVCGTVGLATALAAGDSQEAIIRDLISQRTDTMAGFYAGEIGRDEAIETIAYMETDLLMQTDIENIDRYFRTDIEQVKKYQFEHIRITDSHEDMRRCDHAVGSRRIGRQGRILPYISGNMRKRR